MFSERQQYLQKHLGALEFMLILQELHRRGYQKLRWYSYMSPNGVALRCHITTADNIWGNRDLVRQTEEFAWWCSTTCPTSGEDYHRYLDDFMKEIPELLDKGKGEDPDYVRWFDGVVDKAKNEDFPEFNGEWYMAPLGKIKVGGELYPAPPMSLKIVSWNIDGVKAHFDGLQRLAREYNPDIICLQKFKCSGSPKPFELEGYKQFVSAGPWAGVATYVKEYVAMAEQERPADAIFKGHLLRTKLMYPALTLFNVYVPYANNAVEGAKDKRWNYDILLRKLVALTPDRILMCGDMNIVHDQNDTWDGVFRKKVPNYKDWERDNFNALIKAGGLVDTYRTFHPWGKEFTFFVQNNKEYREKNMGVRLDYFLASESFVPQISKASIIKDITDSPSNPILLEFKN